MALKIVIFEDNPDRCSAMQACLADRFHQYEICLFDDPRQMIGYLQDHLTETLVISLDHDLELLADGRGGWIDPGTGRDVADFLAGQPPACPVVIHSTNAPAVAGMQRVLDEAGWKTYRVTPYDDLAWIPQEWFRTVRRAILDTACPA